MSTHNPDNRPLSPHLSIYSWDFTNIMSIGHRATGVVLSVGIVFIALWLMSIASGPEHFASSWFVWLMTSYLGYFGWFIWSLALFYHLCNGIRHLIWDIGYGFELEDARKSARFVQISAPSLTVMAWVIAVVS